MNRLCHDDSTINIIWVIIIIMLVWYLLLLCVCPSVCHKSTTTAKHRITQTCLAIAQGVLFYDAENLYEIPTGTPNAGGVVKNCVFWPVKKSLAQTPYCWIFLSIRHDGLCSQWCAGRRMHDVINNVGGSRHLFITHRANFSIMCVWQVASHFCCDSLVCCNYAGSQIKRGSWQKCFANWHAIYLLNSLQQ